MFGFLRYRASWSRLPAEIRDQYGADGVIVTAERVGIVAHLSGHVPGVFSSSSAARFQGAFMVTRGRVVATFPTNADPTFLAIDAPWDIARGPGRATLSPKGLRLDIALRGVDPSFSGSMTLNYKHTLTDEALAMVPAVQLWCSIEPALIYRAAGVRPRN